MSTDLEARIAEVIADHIERKTLDDYCEGCSCGWNAGLADAHEEHVAAMLAPVIREAQAEAWEEGRDEPQDCCGMCPAKMCPWDDGGKGPTNPYKAT